MANKKKMEERLEAERQARQARYIQIGGVGIALILVVLAFWVFSPKGASNTPTEPVATVEQPAGAGSEAPQVSALQYAAEPEMTIDVSKKYFATVKMANGGEFVIQLYPEKAPRTVNSFVFLAREGYFNGVTFHRVLDGFMAQGGDPTGTGRGGPGYSFEDEFGSGLTFDKPGLLAMANSGPNTNGSQFFITYVATPHLNNLHTIFGEVIEGMDMVNSLTRRNPEENPNFMGDAMESVTITEE